VRSPAIELKTQVPLQPPLEFAADRDKPPSQSRPRLHQHDPSSCHESRPQIVLAPHRHADLLMKCHAALEQLSVVSRSHVGVEAVARGYQLFSVAVVNEYPDFN
jgi:hypothetical protein